MTDTDIDALPQGERFILVALGEIKATLTSYKDELREHKLFISTELKDVKERLTELERSGDRQSGRIDGMKLMLDIVKFLPPGVLMFLLGKGNLI